MSLAERFGLWCMRRCQADERVRITPLNAEGEWRAASPDTLLFHWVVKRPLRRVARAIRVPRSWLDSLEGTPRILYEVIRASYLDHERQSGRRALLEPVIEYGLCLACFDNNYREVLEAVLAGIVRERDRFAFSPSVINPDNWYQDGRGRGRVEESPPFAVLSRTPETLVVDRRLEGRIVTLVGEAGPEYLALDLACAVELFPGIVAYPVIAASRDVLALAPGLFAGVPA